MRQGYIGKKTTTNYVKKYLPILFLCIQNEQYKIIYLIETIIWEEIFIRTHRHFHRKIHSITHGKYFCSEELYPNFVLI